MSSDSIRFKIIWLNIRCFNSFISPSSKSRCDSVGDLLQKSEPFFTSGELVTTEKETNLCIDSSPYDRKRCRIL